VSAAFFTLRAGLNRERPGGGVAAPLCVVRLA